MRKLLLILFSISFFAAQSSAQFVVNSTYQPMSYEEIAAPYVIVAKFQKECLSALENIAKNTKQVESLMSSDKDPICWDEYADCYNSIIDAYERICNRGTNQQTRGTISELNRRSNSVCSRIRAAYNRRAQLANDQYSRLQSVSGLKCDKFYSDMSLDEFLDGKTPDVNYHR